MRKRKTIWRLWALALGEKTGKNEREADFVALIRTLILVSYMVTNGFIIANAVVHWPKEKPAEAGCDYCPKRIASQDLP
jgi:hypothetical protein